MFETLERAPADPILGLTEAFKKDANPAKINLGVGVYKDGQGNTPVFESVREVQQLLLEQETTKTYLAIDGAPEYAAAVQELLFGADHDIIAGNRAVTAHAPGGTGALRLAADFIHRMFPGTRVWLSDPTWANHPKIFQAAGLAVESYPYFDTQSSSLDFESMLQGLAQIPAGDAVLLHGCCHNPSGVDPSPEQWEQIAGVVEERRLLPLVDFAYQGLGDGLREDAAGLLALCRPGVELLVASSFSKNFGLYNERVGALTLVGTTADAAQTALGHIKICIRTNYSNPPAHGAAIVTAVLGDTDRRRQWEGEVRAMRERINGMRQLFVTTLKEKGVERDFAFIVRQRGMFSFSGLTPPQVEALRERFSLYAVGSGRINVAGMTEGNMDSLCEAIATVL